MPKAFSALLVEPEGFEPSSKQGKNRLSTCLVLFNCRKITAKRQGYYQLSSFSFARIPEHNPHYPAIFDASDGTPARMASRETGTNSLRN